MNVLIGGSNGLIGKVLVDKLRSEGHRVVRLVRRETNSIDEVKWDIPKGMIDITSIPEIDYVIHLGGAPIAQRRWSSSVCDELRDSRIDSTRLLVEAIGSMSVKPKAFLCASAIGIYGERGDEELTEDSNKGDGFLSSLSSEWEEMATKAPVDRIVHLRFGVVLSPNGGALNKMLLPFRLGLGGRIGNGRHYMSWITLSDAVSAVMFLLKDSEVGGAVNIVSPYPVRNKEFTRLLGLTLRRPVFLPVPILTLRLLYGDMVDEVLLASQRVNPKVLTEKGFQFHQPKLETALPDLLKKL